MLKRKIQKSPDHAKLGVAVEKLLIDDYIYVLGSTRHQIWGAIVRGFFTGLTGVVGATLGVALFLTILQYLGGAPIIGHYIRDIADAISQAKN